MRDGTPSRQRDHIEKGRSAEALLVGQAGLEPATNGLATGTSRPNQICTVSSCATTGFAINQFRREPDDFHRFLFNGGEYSVTHLATMMMPSSSCDEGSMCRPQASETGVVVVNEQPDAPQ